MTEIHPTTMAIVAGLQGQEHERDYIASNVRRLVQETGLIDAEDIARIGLEGWDLGYRQQGQRFELTARSSDDPQYEKLITAMIDRRSSATWSYHWLISIAHLATADAGELYPNGSASSFGEALDMARAKVIELRVRNGG